MLKIDFVNAEGKKLSFTEEKPARDGIYIPIVKFTEPGIYKMTINLNGRQVSDEIVVENVHVFANEGELPHAEEETSSSISFLKEQQWKIDFANEPASKKILFESVRATGVIKTKPESHSKVISPVSGVVLSKSNRILKSIGSFVKRGEVLLEISPSADASASIQKIKNDFLLAQSELERVENLFSKGAASKKRLDEARFDFESKRAVFNSLSNQIKINEEGYSVLAPIDGYIEKTNFVAGDQVAPGQELFTIINRNRLILQANVPSSKLEAALNSKNASFKVEGLTGEFNLSELSGRKISVAASLDEQNRTIPVYYEFTNPQNKIKIGMYAEVFVKVGDQKEVIAIPESSIIDEDGLHTIYIQVEGEAFEKRIVKTGIADGGYIQILEGLKEGERVVTKGAYQVRLAALSPESAIGHGHVH